MSATKPTNEAREVASEDILQIIERLFPGLNWQLSREQLLSKARTFVESFDGKEPQ